MPTNGTNCPLKLQFGLINHESRYLTAEAFGFKVNASAPSLKRKQVWTLEQDSQDPQVVYLRSHLGRYLASDKDGKVTCEAEGRNTDCRFLIAAQSDGRWALQSEPYLRLFGGSRDYLSCFAQVITEAELWAVHLALHPQANLLSVARKRYAHLSPDDGEIAVDRNIPWGVAALLTLVYLEGKYRLKTCDSRYLVNDGKLSAESGRGTGYTLELKCGKLAFKDCEGKYLSPMGPTGTLRSGRCSKPGKDELFDLEESHPQVVLMAANGKYVSIRQRVSISANQEDETDLETFQMEIDKESRKCLFRTNEGKYWALVAHGGIQTTTTERSANTMFAVEWMGRRVALRASNGKYICTKKNGQLAAISDSIGEDEKLILKLINRPMLILRGLNGFICHHKNSNTLDANRSVYDIFTLHFSDGAYHIKGEGGRFWYVNSSGLVCSDGETPDDFSFEFLEHGRIAIRGKNGRYLRGQGGMLKGDGVTPDSSALWEY
ncbi:fascin-2 [Oncorhynchus tshawytscha]|uniref:Fascin n=2 Tax=Oncorhynchus TaxID=8016 RepID=A0A8C7DRC8_ONCKI|nr:fascin-2 [Oncorhynchus tshawytscha]XP_031660368.1 fascin-2-like [Oncorhynchus kisutch]XP_035657172.1 fascin-2-like [Oncorhynchus keta]XP_052334012.1 fascin-2-like [Oncorhynchus keta]